MGNRQISLLLVFLLLCPLFIGVQADGEDELNFESQNFTAGYDSVNETTTLSWGNADTNDYLVLEELKTTNYTLYRSDEPLNTSNYPQSEMIQDGIQACLALDSFTECKERTHHVVYEVPPSTDGNYYYGVTSTLENGTVISNFSEGDNLVKLVDPADIFCDSTQCALIKNGELLYMDGNHLSSYGSTLLIPLILKTLLSF